MLTDMFTAWSDSAFVLVVMSTGMSCDHLAVQMIFTFWILEVLLFGHRSVTFSFCSGFVLWYSNTWSTLQMFLWLIMQLGDCVIRSWRVCLGDVGDASLYRPYKWVLLKEGLWYGDMGNAPLYGPYRWVLLRVGLRWPSGLGAPRPSGLRPTACEGLAARWLSLDFPQIFLSRF